MNKYKLTFEVNGTEEAVRALIQHMKEDILPNSYGVVFEDDESWGYKTYEKEVGTYVEKDIQNCAIENGFEPLKGGKI